MQNSYSKDSGKKSSQNLQQKEGQQTTNYVHDIHGTVTQSADIAKSDKQGETYVHSSTHQLTIASALEQDLDSTTQSLTFTQSFGSSAKVSNNSINSKADSKGAFLLSKIKDDLVEVIGQSNVNRWLDKLHFHKIDDAQFIIYAENKFVKQWISANYAKDIEKALVNLHIDKTLKIIEKSDAELENSLLELAKANSVNNGNLVESGFEEIVANDVSFVNSNSKSIQGYNNENIRFGQTLLNNEMRFDNFIVGEFNQYAYEICNSIAKGNIGKFTPILIYGATGLGKTHLMNALTYSLHQNYPKLKVKFINGKIFVDNVILATRQNLFDELYKEYESTDVLIIDDIQMLGKTTKSLEVFFYIFDTLYNEKKQIILTSDKNPKEMEEFEERYLSRFQGGPLFEIIEPNFEEKVALLQAKSEELHINIDSDVVYYIARKIDATNIRELVGTVATLALYDSLGKELTIEFVTQNLKNIITAEGTKEPTIDDIIGEVCAYFRIKQADITSKLRTQSVVYARQVAMYFIRDILHYSLQDIADLFKINQHTTVKHAVTKIEEKIINDEETKLHIDKIRATIVGF